LIPIPGDVEVCGDIESDGNYNIVTFNLDDKGKVATLQMTGLDFNDIYVRA